jgi:hypothetical protein
MLETASPPESQKARLSDRILVGGHSTIVHARAAGDRGHHQGNEDRRAAGASVGAPVGGRAFTIRRDQRQGRAAADRRSGPAIEWWRRPQAGRSLRLSLGLSPGRRSCHRLISLPIPFPNRAGGGEAARNGMVGIVEYDHGSAVSLVEDFRDLVAGDMVDSNDVR